MTFEETMAARAQDHVRPLLALISQGGKVGVLAQEVSDYARRWGGSTQGGLVLAWLEARGEVRWDRETGVVYVVRLAEGRPEEAR